MFMWKNNNPAEFKKKIWSSAFHENIQDINIFN